MTNREEDGVERGAPDAGAPARAARPSSPPTEGVRIAAVEAAVAAGLVPSTGRRLTGPQPTGADEASLPPVPPLELPDWSDPPTGQVPRILLGDDPDSSADDDGVVMRGPTWREDRADWDEDLDLSFLVDDAEQVGIAGHASEVDRVDDPFNFSFEDLEPPSPTRTTRTGEVEVVEVPDGPGVADDVELADAAWDSLLNPGVSPALRGVAPRQRRRERRGARSALHGGRRLTDPSAAATRATSAEPVALPGEPSARPWRRDRKPRPSHAARPERRTPAPPSSSSEGAPTAAPKGRNPFVATATGIVAGAVALGCFALGPVASLVLVAVLVTLAAGEAFGAMRRAGLAPLAPLGLIAVPALVVAAYLRGPVAVGVVASATVLVGFSWYLASAARRDDPRRRPVTNLGATLLVVAWVGLLGSFAGLLLGPAAYPHRHGIALVVGAAVLAVAADVGAYATGAKLGRHPLAKRISPHKSWEGFVGGTVLTLVVAALVVSRIHPFTVGHALLLGVVICIVAPIGDLAESLVKRDLGIKDMGALLPAHGGVLDRVDGLLFVLPITYYLAHLVHLV